MKAKRALDVVVSAVALLLLAPVLIAVAFAVRVTMGSPVLFRQSRPGLHGELFELTKFRTMRTGGGSDADRLTRAGAFIRSTSLDELPELMNILKGEMSLVGPRPLLTEYLPLYSERQATRHEVRPGLTGLAQVSGRNALSWEDRLELDAVYVETQSLKGDIRILLKTLRIVARRSGVSGEGEVTMAKFEGNA